MASWASMAVAARHVVEQASGLPGALQQGGVEAEGAGGIGQLVVRHSGGDLQSKPARCCQSSQLSLTQVTSVTLSGN